MAAGLDVVRAAGADRRSDCSRSSVAAAFIIGQSDLKRLLAYSSVEHMGLLVLGLGLGGVGRVRRGAARSLNNGLAKG